MIPVTLTGKNAMTAVISVLRWIGLVLLAILLVIAIYVFAMRFADGPSGIVAGGPFTTGELHTGPEPDWRAMRTRAEVEFQLLDPARSRTTWIAEYDGRIFIPSGYMTTSFGKLWKQWPPEAEVDGRALLRVDDTIYERTLVRFRDGDALDPVLSQLGQKYIAPTMGIPDTPAARDALLADMRRQVADGTLWLFELQPR